MSNASDFIIENGVLKKYVGPGGDVVIPDGVASIGAKVFGTAKGVESVFLPDSVTAIGDRAFYGVPLDKVHIPDSVLKIKECRHIIYVDILFFLCKKIKEWR